MPVSKGKILLVEDDPVYQRLVQGILEREGYDTCPFVISGEDAIEEISRCDPDLVLMDIRLPGELNGIEAAERIQNRVNIPVVFLSGDSDPATLRQVGRAAPYGFVAKPFSDGQLVVAVETAFHRHRLDCHVQDSRDWLSTVLASVADGVVSIDVRGIVTFINEAGTALLGPACLGHSFSDVLAGVVRDVDGAAKISVNRILDGDGPPVFEQSLGLDCADGGQRTVQLISKRLMDQFSRWIGAVVILRDITESERMIQQLRSFKLAVDSMQIGVTMTDLDRKILFVNPADAEMHGYGQSELLGCSARYFGTPSNETMDDSWPDDLGRWRRESLNKRADGSTFPVELLTDVVRDSQGEPVGLVTCCRDLTEMKQAEEEIRKLNQAVEQSPALVIITDVTGRIEYVNSQFCRTTGYSVEEAVGNLPSILKGPETPESAYEDLWKTISRGNSWSGEFHNKKKDGSTYWAFASISGLRDEAGVIRHYVGVQVDITRRKELEVQLEAQNTELERLNRLKSDMVAITSHDLKSPLHAMVSVANLLRDLGPQLDTETREGFIDQIISSGRKLSSFISDILDAEKIEAGGISLGLAYARVDRVVEDCIALVGAAARERSVEITSVIEGPFDEILVDAGKLEQVFTNLLSNALKFSPEKSRIEVRMVRDAGSQVITIGDRGPGVPEDERERIFDRYFQATSGGEVAERGFGVGLGLYIVRLLVEAHEGSVEARNREGGGCLFVVRLPEGQHDQGIPRPCDQTGMPGREGRA